MAWAICHGRRGHFVIEPGGLAFPRMNGLVTSAKKINDVDGDASFGTEVFKEILNGNEYLRIAAEEVRTQETSFFFKYADNTVTMSGDLNCLPDRVQTLEKVLGYACADHTYGSSAF